jgi:hypothetical protein
VCERDGIGAETVGMKMNDAIRKEITSPLLVRLITSLRIRNNRTIILITALTMLAACQVIGPSAIEHGRLNYTSVIESTSKTTNI